MRVSQKDDGFLSCDSSSVLAGVAGEATVSSCVMGDPVSGGSCVYRLCGWTGTGLLGSGRKTSRLNLCCRAVVLHRLDKQQYHMLIDAYLDKRKEVGFCPPLVTAGHSMNLCLMCADVNPISTKM